MMRVCLLQSAHLASYQSFPRPRVTPRCMASQKQPSVDRATYNQRWEKDWVAGVAKWDKGQASNVLLNLIKSGVLPVKDKRVIVPGCGRGYDVVEFAAAGAVDVVGLDISASGVKAAQEHWAASGVAEDVLSRSRFVQGDFFSFHDDRGAFDIGYDYTFLCALHPDMRQLWLEGWTRALKPGGELVTLVFPVDPALEGKEGPPWPVTPELYHSLLSGSFSCISLEPVPLDQSHPDRQGKEYIGRWRRL